MSTLIKYKERNPSFPLEWKDCSIDLNCLDLVKTDLNEKELLLNENELQEYKELIQRLTKICEIASKRNVKLLIDAEQTYYQPGI